MSPEAKQLKLMGIATMFIGLAVVVLGAILIVQDFDLTDLVPLFLGTFDTVLGAQGARAANVPSSAERLLPASITVGLISLAAGGALYFFDMSKLAALIAAGAAAILAFCITVSIRRIKKDLERV